MDVFDNDIEILEQVQNDIKNLKKKRMLKIILSQFWKVHSDDLFVFVTGAGTFGLLLTDIDVILKCMVSAATLFYIGCKIYSHFKNK